MEKFFALCVCIPLLIVWVPQYGLNTTNNVIITKASIAVEEAKEEARQEGYFTEDILSELTDNLKAEGLDGNKITINVTTTPKYRLNSYDEREMISYNIGIPIEKTIVANDFFMISDEDNYHMHYFKGKIASERI